jgi:hypothetical protein
MIMTLEYGVNNPVTSNIKNHTIGENNRVPTKGQILSLIFRRGTSILDTTEINVPIITIMGTMASERGILSINFAVFLPAPPAPPGT